MDRGANLDERAIPASFPLRAAASYVVWLLQYTPYPDAYFLTFTCHGVRLHGDPDGSVDRFHNSYGSSLVGPHRRLHGLDAGSNEHRAVFPDRPRRGCVLQAILETCVLHGWLPWTVHVRTTHVHAVISAPQPAKALRRAVKTLCHEGPAPRRFRCNPTPQVDPQRKHWVHLWNRPDRLEAAVIYVAAEQGQPLELFVHPRARKFVNPSLMWALLPRVVLCCGS